MVLYRVYDKNRNYLFDISGKKASSLTPVEYLEFVSCLVIRKGSGKIVTEVRNSKKDGGGLYDFCSGHLNYDETHRQAVVRELEEELGIPENISNPSVVSIGSITLRKANQFLDHGCFIEIFTLTIPENLQLKKQVSEVASIKELPFSAVRKLLESNQFLFPFNPDTKAFLKQIESRLIDLGLATI